MKIKKIEKSTPISPPAGGIPIWGDWLRNSLIDGKVSLRRRTVAAAIEASGWSVVGTASAKETPPPQHPFPGPIFEMGKIIDRSSSWTSGLPGGEYQTVLAGNRDPPTWLSNPVGGINCWKGRRVKLYREFGRKLGWKWKREERLKGGGGVDDLYLPR